MEIPAVGRSPKAGSTQCQPCCRPQLWKCSRRTPLYGDTVTSWMSVRTTGAPSPVDRNCDDRTPSPCPLSRCQLRGDRTPARWSVSKRCPPRARKPCDRFAGYVASSRSFRRKVGLATGTVCLVGSVVE